MRPQYERAYTERGIEDEPPGSPIPFIASTPGVKRDGLDLRASGWRIDTFRRNPVFLWAHGRVDPAIGRVDASVGEVLRTNVTFDQDDPFARKIESKYRRGFLSAVSVGWDFVDANGARMDVYRMSLEDVRDKAFYDLTELSGVPVPADPDALVARQRAALRTLGRELVDLFDEQENPESDATAADIRAAVAAELQRLGIALPTQDSPPPPAKRVSAEKCEVLIGNLTIKIKERHA
jgi:hypothetical protein